MSVLVENAAEAIVAACVEAGDLVRISDRRGQWIQRAGIRDALMRPMGFVELFESAQGVEQMQFILGIRTPLSTPSMPASARIASNKAGHFPSRSRIKNCARQRASVPGP